MRGVSRYEQGRGVFFIEIVARRNYSDGSVY